jgi:hypothetical protein
MGKGVLHMGQVEEAGDREKMTERFTIEKEPWDGMRVGGSE